jgi:hypothetical protein
MNPLSSLLRRAADTLDSINVRVEEHRNDEDAPLLDTEAVNEAVVTLSASTISAVLDIFDSLPRPFHREETVTEQSSDLIEQEVDKVIGRMGLVQEDELAALRKRVVELEQRLENK